MRINLFVLVPGKDSPGCGFSEKKACSTLNYALAEYQKRFTIPWYENTALHTNIAITMYQPTCSWNVTKDKDVCFSLVNDQGGLFFGIVHFRNCTFSHITIQVSNVSLDFQNSTFVDSAVLNYNSSFMNFKESKWINMTRINGITAFKMERITLDKCNFSETKGADISGKKLEMVLLKNVTNIKIQTVLFRNVKVNQGTSTKLIFVSNSKSCVIDDIVIVNTKQVVGLYLENTVSVRLTSCVFKTNQISQTNNSDNAALVVVRSKVQIKEGNFFSNDGSIIISRLSNVNVNACRFIGNIIDQGRYSVGGALISYDSHLTMSNCTFNLNVGVKGGSVSVLASDGVSAEGCSIVGENLYFNNNTANLGGALYVTSSCGMHLNRAYFQFNEGQESGGALYIQTPHKDSCGNNKYQRMPIDSYVIKNSKFDKNWAHIAGGSVYAGCINYSLPIPQLPHCDTTSAYLAINATIFLQSNNLTYEKHTKNYIYGGTVASYINTNIASCSFIENIGYLAGGVFFYGAKNSLINVTFHENTANISGSAVYAENAELRMENCSIRDTLEVDHNKDISLLGSIYQMAFYSVRLTFSDVHVQLYLDTIDPTEIHFIDFESDYPHPNSPFGNPGFGINNATFICPVNYRPVLRSTESIDSACDTIQIQTVCLFTRTLSIVCQRSDTNKYIAGPGTFVVNTKSSLNPYDLKFDEPFNCPVPGGNCINQLRALPGYYGFFKNEMSEEVKFVNCPTSLCCTDESNCLSYDSCNSNRKGVLCSECDTNYTEALFSKNCIKDSKCDEILAYGLLFGISGLVFCLIGCLTRFGLAQHLPTALSKGWLCLKLIPGKCSCRGSGSQTPLGTHDMSQASNSNNFDMIEFNRNHGEATPLLTGQLDQNHRKATLYGTMPVGQVEGEASTHTMAEVRLDPNQEGATSHTMALIHLEPDQGGATSHTMAKGRLDPNQGGAMAHPTAQGQLDPDQGVTTSYTVAQIHLDPDQGGAMSHTMAVDQLAPNQGGAVSHTMAVDQLDPNQGGAVSHTMAVDQLDPNQGGAVSHTMAVDQLAPNQGGAVSHTMAVDQLDPNQGGAVSHTMAVDQLDPNQGGAVSHTMAVDQLDPNHGAATLHTMAVGQSTDAGINTNSNNRNSNSEPNASFCSRGQKSQENWPIKNILCLWCSAEKIDSDKSKKDDNGIVSIITPFISFFMIILYMIQDFSLFHMNLYDCSEHWHFERLHQILFGSSSTSTLLVVDNLCLKSLFGLPVTEFRKLFFKWLFYLGVYFAIGFWYIVFAYCSCSCFCSCCHRDSKTNEACLLSSIEGFIAFKLMIYQDLSEDAVSMFDCVNIKGTRYLQVDSTRVCGKTWEIGATIYFGFCFVLFAFFIMIGPSLLRKGKIKLWMFNAAMFNILIGLIGLLCSFIWGNVLACKSIRYLVRFKKDESAQSSPENHSCAQDENTADRNEKIANFEILGSSFRTIYVGKGKINGDSLTEENRKKSTYITWLGVILLYRLSLVCSSLLIPDVGVSAFVMFLISLCRYVVETNIKPYKTTWLNRIYSWSLFLIVIVASCSLCMAIMERNQYQNCSTDSLLKAIAFTIDVCTMYIPLILAGFISIGLFAALCAFVGEF